VRGGYEAVGRERLGRGISAFRGRSVSAGWVLRQFVAFADDALFVSVRVVIISQQIYFVSEEAVKPLRLARHRSSRLS
jgi:hypothetical protein